MEDQNMENSRNFRQEVDEYIVQIRNLDFQMLFYISIGFYVLLNIVNILLINTIDPENYPGILFLMNVLVFFIALIQDRSRFKAKYFNNRLLLIGFASYVSYITGMIASGNTVLVIQIAIYTSIYGLWAISLNMSTGIVGILNFGVIAQVAVGAVFTGIASLNGWPIFLAVIGGMFSAGLFSAALAFTTVRLRDDYFAIISITIGEVFRQILNTDPHLRAARNLPEGQEFPSTPGILDMPLPFFDTYLNAISGTFLEEYNYGLFLAFFALFILIVVYYLVDLIFNSPYGRVLRSIREDATVVEAYGKDVLKYKVVVMFLSGMVAGLGGSLYGWVQSSLFPNNFQPVFTFYVWVAFIIGGRGNNKGMILGGIIFVVLERTSRLLNDSGSPLIKRLNEFVLTVNPDGPQEVSFGFLQLIVVGLFLILFLRYAPQGILPEEPYEPDIDGYSLPDRGSQSEDQKSITGGTKHE